MLDDVASTIGALTLGELVDWPETKEDEEGQPGEGGEGKPPDGEGDEKSKDQVRQEIRSALQKAQEEVDEYENVAGMIWGNDPSTRQQVSPDERIELAKNLKQLPKLKTLAKLIGKFRIMAEQAQRRKVQYMREEMTDITLGNDLMGLVPSELVLLAVPELEPLFIKDF